MNHHDMPAAPGADPSRSWIQRALQRRHVPKYLFVLACLVTLGAVALTILGRPELRAQESQGGDKALSPPAKAERAEAEKFVPAPVPEEQNFAATPFLAATLEKGRGAESPAWPDDFSRADQWPKVAPLLPA